MSLKRSSALRTINVLAALSFAILALRTSLIDRPEWFSRSGRIGELAYEISLAYLGAWFFNKLVVDRPRDRDRRAIYSIAGNRVAQIAHAGTKIAREISRAHDTLAPGQPDGEYVARLLRKTDPRGRSAMLASASGPPWIYLSWIEFMYNELRVAEQRIQEIIPVYAYLDAETIRLVGRLRGHHLNFAIKTIVVDRMPLDNTDMSAFAETFFSYWQISHELELHYMAEIWPRMDPASRLTLR